MTKLFKTEAELCARFVSAVEPDAWTVYPETAGWDLLLVRKSDGFQIGVQAKLALNPDVILQTTEYSGTYHVMEPGPDCRAVLVPADASSRLAELAFHVGVTVIRCAAEPERHRYGANRLFRPELPDPEDTLYESKWRELAPAKRETLPAYIPDSIAGSRAPLQLTRWKIAAMKLAILLARRGYLTRADFKQHRVDHRLWVAKWLAVVDGHFVAGHYLPDFQAQHPRNWQEIEADAKNWMSKEDWDRCFNKPN